MPTGYTYYIQEGKINNAKDFILLCARNFGATISMKDKSLDTQIPEFRVNTYHLESLNKAKERLEETMNMTDEQIQEKIEQDYNKELEYRKEKIKEALDLKNKYLSILDDIYEWEIPTQEHANLKKFAIEQIQSSIEVDCNIEYYERTLIKPTIEEHRKYSIESALKSIEYHARSYKDELKSMEERNKWIKDLKESLK